MEQDKKNVIKFIAIMMIYILLSALGIFSLVGMVLFPIVALPWVIFCITNKVDTKYHIIFHGIVSIVIYLMVHSILGVLIYVVSVMVPTYITLFLYKQELPIPNIIMCGGLMLSVIAFAYFAIFKGLGIDFEAQFGTGLDLIKNQMETTFDSLLMMNPVSGMSTMELQSTVTQMKELITLSIESLKVLYGTIIVSQIMICFALTIIIFNTVVKRKIKSLPSINQLFGFRVSKVAVLLLVMCMFVSDYSASVSSGMLMLALNLMSFLMSLLEIVGMLALITLLRRTSISRGIKLLGYIGILLLFIVSPYILMFFGCLDAIFNYRKVSIVV